YVKFDKRRKIPVTILLRALGYGTNEEILSLFPYKEEIEATIKKDPSNSYHEGLLELFRRLRPNEPPNIDSAKQTLYRMLFDPKRYDLGDVGRYKINKKLSIQERIVGLSLSDEPILDKDGSIIAEPGVLITKSLAEKIEELRIPKVKVIGPEGEVEVWLELPETFERVSDNVIGRRIKEDIYDDEGNLIIKCDELIDRDILKKLKKVREKILVEKGKSLTPEDILGFLRYLQNLKRGVGKVDDIDHLGIRRVKAVGELLQNHLRAGFLKLESSIKEKMSLQPEGADVTPQSLINVRPITAIINQFFGSSQLSQFMDHVNPLSALTHKRRLSALGPGGLTREHAGFEVRDVHATHYGRICPVETPEGPNIGLIGTLAVYARINSMGFIETPYRVVKDGKVTNEVKYLTAIDEEGLKIAPANINLDAEGNILDKEVPVRYNGRAVMVS
ncbi:MAG TPA: DNA-directed RNA polymerase subunit beta, partial [Candidatus Atribacteria bacterium]|nr:DNA-directed RNA polymerase subunit beta [Candidatus Atribacteria bacterium]